MTEVSEKWFLLNSVNNDCLFLKINIVYLIRNWINLTSFSISFISVRSKYHHWQWPQEFMANPTWHLISTIWSGMNYVLRVFIDGKEVLSEFQYGHQSFTGDVRFGLHVPDGRAFPIRLTSINMWNHVLSADVIAAHVKSCDAAIGNIKEWYDAWPILKEKRGFITKPATCSAPTPNPSYSEGVASDLHQSSAKSLFIKNKKEKSSTKSGGKRYH